MHPILATFANFFAPRALTLAQRRAARQAANAHSNCPVDLVDGDAAPRMTGRSYYWTTLSGKTEVRYPNAYGWPTWYHCSTLAVTVGREWFARG
ncbi:MAG TPA: hypothetical protein VGH74_07640 [Planctomycetaceae bacterium]|jgi:hypothetical protein